MPTYQDIGLNQYFQPINTPVSSSRGAIESFGFQSGIERSTINTMSIADLAVNNAKIGSASINDAKIGTLTFSVIAGGTANFGGTSNGNGVVSVKDSGGTERVRLDNSGVTVIGGSISVQNDSGSTSFDNKGVVSAQNFVTANTTASYTGTILQSIDSTSYTDLTNSSTTFVLGRAAFVLVLANAIQSVSIDAGTTIWSRGFLTVNVDGSSTDQAIEDARHDVSTGDYRGGGNTIYSNGIHYFTSLAAGTHTVKLQGKVANVSGPSGGTLQIWGFRQTYIIYGT